METRRLLELAVVLAVLPLAALLGLGLALVVRVLDGPPVFFRQERLGRGRRPFVLLKFRTMLGQRVTPVGRWLRTCGLDEIPQLLNVLRGEMSLVGPRPLTADDVRRLGWEEPRFEQRFRVPPGLTGPAQLQLSRVCDVRATWVLDRDYACNRSAWTDLRILGATAVIALLGKSAGGRILRRCARGRP